MPSNPKARLAASCDPPDNKLRPDLLTSSLLSSPLRYYQVFNTFVFFFLLFLSIYILFTFIFYLFFMFST